MEIKGILEKIRQKEVKKEFFFALEIDPELVKSAIWVIVENQVKVFAIGDTHFWKSEEDLIQATDATLSSMMEKFVPSSEFVEPNKVVLGLPPDWVAQDKIVAEKTGLLKNVSQNLDLNPIGFVIISEAIVYHLKTTDGVPPTAIIVGLGKKRLTVILSKLGRIIGTQLVERSESLGADLNEGLSRFDEQEAFPARILLYGTEKLEEARQELVSYNWQSQNVNFLHLPKIEILPVDFDIQAIVLAGGKEVSKGQVQGFSIGKEKAEEKESQEPETMGFVEEKDISEQEPKPVLKEEKKPFKVEKKLKNLKIPKINLGLFFNFLKDKFKKISLPKLSTRWLPITGVIFAFLLIFFGAAIAFWWYFPKAQIVLFIKPRVLEKDFVVKLDPSSQTADSENLILPAEQLETTIEGEKTAKTTGTKIVGDPAKGKVTIYKVPGAEKKFAAGTIITSSSGIKFTLNEEALIASRSSAADPTPSTIVAVTAEKIGPEGNLAAGAEFTIANFAKSDYVAKNESAFTEGKSREVQAVSKKDQEKLIEDLTKELKDKAGEELKTKIESQNKLVEESLNSKIVEKSFSKEIDAEADEVSLKMKIKLTALSYSEEDFKKIIQEQIEKSVPEGFEYRPEESEISFNLKEVNKEGVAIFSARYKTNLIPKLDLENIKKNLSGKQVEIGNSYLNGLPNIDSFEAKITSKLPIKVNTFPRVIKNIKIEISVR